MDATWGHDGSLRSARALGFGRRSFLRHAGETKNHLTENAIRSIAVGKKNWMFVGGEDTGERITEIYTVIESAKRNGHEPYTYLKDDVGAAARDEGGGTRRLAAGKLEARRPTCGPAANRGLKTSLVNGCLMERLRGYGQITYAPQSGRFFDVDSIWLYLTAPRVQRSK